MGKKVVVIAFVVCLDLAFVILMRAALHFDAYSQMTEPDAEPPVLIARRPEIPQQAAPEEIPLTEPVQSPEIVRSSRRIPVKMSKSVGTRTNWSSDRSRQTDDPPLRTYSKKESAEKLTNTIIWIEKPNFGRNVQAHVQAPPKELDPAAPTNYTAAKIVKKKRSAISRVVHIIRKPYDWLKAVALHMK